MVSEKDIEVIGEYFKKVIRIIDKMDDKKRLRKKYEIIDFFDTILRDEKEDSNVSKDTEFYR